MRTTDESLFFFFKRNTWNSICFYNYSCDFTFWCLTIHMQIHMHCMMFNISQFGWYNYQIATRVTFSTTTKKIIYLFINSMYDQHLNSINHYIIQCEILISWKYSLFQKNWMYDFTSIVDFRIIQRKNLEYSHGRVWKVKRLYCY